MARLPLNQLAVLLFCTLSIDAADVARCDRRAVAVGDDRSALNCCGVLQLAVRLNGEASCCGPYSVPVGTLRVAALHARCVTSSMPIWRVASALGSSCTRTAYFCAPKTCTCATPFTIEMRCAIGSLAAFVDLRERQRRRGQREIEDRRVGRVHLAGTTAASACPAASCADALRDRRLHVLRGARR